MNNATRSDAVSGGGGVVCRARWGGWALISFVMALETSLLVAAEPEYRCVQASGPITIDGKLDEADWAAAEPITLRRTQDGEAARAVTTARMLWDDKALYVAWVCEDEDIWATKTNKDANLWEDEVVEVFIDPDGDGKDYVELEINAANAIVDLKVASASPLKADAGWDIAGLKTAVNVEGTLNRRNDKDKRWTVEAAIPWAGLTGIPDVGNGPAAGSRWRMNLYRIEHFNDTDPKNVELLAWSPTGRGFFHVPDRFGSVVFVKSAPKSAQIPVLNWEQRSDWVNVKSSGAVGDGMADDTEAIQKALSGVKSGTTIYFPPGTYRITRTLELGLKRGGRLLGVQIIGHGRDTKLVWDGKAAEKLWIDDGVTLSRYVGLLFDGRNKAAVGFCHENSNGNFETGLRHQHLAFLNFTEAGVMTGLKEPASSEVTFENCLFENCGKGLSISKVNDYNFTIAGCEFHRCGLGIYCQIGNFYVRDCRFEGSREADISAVPAHGSSIRRCASVGSFMFLKYDQLVAPLTVQDCQVSGWKNPDGAISYAGAPLIMFDCVFSVPPGANPPVNITRADQPLILSENKFAGTTGVLRTDPRAQVFAIPAGRRSASLKTADARFLKSEVRVPGKVFDARRDFGAKGDGREDDTAAVQKCIDAAREHGHGAVAYLPNGCYVISQTLNIAGNDYCVGGGGYNTMLLWRGADEGIMIAVRDPKDVTLENINVGNHDVNVMNSGIQLKNSIDILQTGSDQPSKMTYDGVWVFGKYQKQPNRKGLVCRNLGSESVVKLNCVEGNLRFTDCAAATILANTTYEGSLTVDGKDPRRTGLLGFMTRMATLVTHSIYIRDNQDVVISDFMTEQSDGGYVFEGGPGLPEGRASIGNQKLHFGADGNGNYIPGDPLTISNYAGKIFWGPLKPREGAAKTWRIVQTGDRPVTVWLYAACFFSVLEPAPELQRSATLYMMALERVAPVIGARPEPLKITASYAPPPDKLAQISEALDDFRRLGEMDLQLNYGKAGF